MRKRLKKKLEKKKNQEIEIWKKRVTKLLLNDLNQAYETPKREWFRLEVKGEFKK